MQWGLLTLGIIAIPLAICQCYSLFLLRTDNNSVRATALCLHVLLLGIPYRYDDRIEMVLGFLY